MNICIYESNKLINAQPINENPDLFVYNPQTKTMNPIDFNQIKLCPEDDIRNMGILKNIYTCDNITGKYRIEREQKIYNTLNPKPTKYYNYELEYRKYEKIFDNLNIQYLQLMKKIKLLQIQENMLAQQSNIILESITNKIDELKDDYNTEQDILTSMLEKTTNILNIDKRKLDNNKIISSEQQKIIKDNQNLSQNEFNNQLFEEYVVINMKKNDKNKNFVDVKEVFKNNLHFAKFQEIFGQPHAVIKLVNDPQVIKLFDETLIENETAATDDSFNDLLDRISNIKLI